VLRTIIIIAVIVIIVLVALNFMRGRR